MHFVHNNLRHGSVLYLPHELPQYPQEAKENKIQGRVTVSFVVEKDGTLTDVKVIGNPYKYISEEAVRVVKAMPKWNPAKIKGKIVRSRFRLPVNFRLN